jgi:hypothetical protein
METMRRAAESADHMRRFLGKPYALNARPALDAYAWPGGYTIAYVTNDCDLLCAACATDTDDAEMAGADTYDEGPTEYCAGCNTPIESSYGDPDSDE